MEKFYQQVRSGTRLGGVLLGLGLMLIQWSLAQVGTSLSFDGVDDYVSIPGSRTLSPASFTVEFWIKIDALSRQKIGVIDKGYAQRRNWYFLQDANRLNLIFGVGQPFGSSELTLRLGDHQWHHVAGTFDGRTMRAYLDGVEVGHMNASMSLNQHLDLHLGKALSGPGCFRGQLDELRIWNQARSEREIGRGMYRQTPSNPRGLIGYWPLDEGEGSQALDRSGFSQHGSLMAGPLWRVSGAWAGPRQALNFDGRDDHLVVSDHRDLDLTHDFTIELWFKVDRIAQGLSQILEKEIGYGLAVEPEGITFSVHNRRDYSVEHPIPTGEWVHLAVVMDRSNDVAFYLNGQALSTVSGSSPCFTSATSLYIGSGSFGQGNFFDGQIDELRLWHQTRSQADIQANMYRTLSGEEQHLAAYYRFDQTGSTQQPLAFDYTGHGHEASLNRMSPATAWVSAAPFSTWVGAEDGDWNNPNNWSGQVVPTHQPVGLYAWNQGFLPTNGDIALGQCFIAQNVNMEHRGTLTLSGSLINHGDFTSRGTVRLMGGQPQVITGQGRTQVADLIVNNPGGVTVQQDLVVDGDLSLLQGSLSLELMTLTLNGGVIVGGGQWRGSPGTNLVVAGRGPSLGLPALQVNDLTLQRNSGMVLDGNLMVLGTLHLQRGQLDLNGQILELDENARMRGNFGPESHIRSVNGFLRKHYRAAGAFTFPLGDGIHYTPITLDFSHGDFSSAYLDVALAVAQHPQNTSPSHYLNRYWIVNHSGISNFNCDVIAEYNEADVVGDEGQLAGGKWDGHSWLSLGPVDGFRNQITGTIHGFSDFTAGEAATFPVEWLGFEARTVGEQVNLQWKTATEVNSHYFGVERSPDQQAWEEVGRVAAAGHSQEVQQYDFRDEPPRTGQWYYRLRQVDLDGSFSYSSQVAVNLSGLSFSAYPNPVRDRLYLQAKGAWTAELQDFSGRVVAHYQGKGPQTLDLGSLAAGAYVLRVNLAGQPRIVQLTKE